MTTLQPTDKQPPEYGSSYLSGTENPHIIGIHWFVDEEGVVSSEFILRLRPSSSLRAVLNFS